MSFKELKCGECGGNLEFDKAKGILRCTYCGTSYSDKGEINNFHNASIGKIENANFVTNDENSFEKIMDRADAFMDIHQDYDKAYNYYKEAADLHPRDYSTWWGMVRAGTWDFAMDDSNEAGLLSASGDMTRAVSVASEKEKKEIAETWNNYIGNFIVKYESELGTESELINICSGEKGEMDTDINERLINYSYNETNIKKNVERISELNNELSNIDKPGTYKDIFAGFITLGVMAVVLVFFVSIFSQEFRDWSLSIGFNLRYLEPFIALHLLVFVLFIALAAISCAFIAVRNDVKKKKLIELIEQLEADNAKMGDENIEIKSFKARYADCVKTLGEFENEKKTLEDKITFLKNMLV